MRTFTSVYQLLPIYPSLDVGGTYRRVAETDGIPGVDRRRAEQALSFHREIEKAVEAHQKDLDYLKRGYKILPIVGTRQPTLQSAQMTQGRVTANRQLPPATFQGAVN